jgi:hypothetical protein
MNLVYLGINLLDKGVEIIGDVGFYFTVHSWYICIVKAEVKCDENNAENS